MLTGSSTSPFAAIESVIYKTLFSGSSSYAALTADAKQGNIDNGATNQMTSTTTTKESSKNVAAGKGKSKSLKAKEESENAEGTSKKTN